MDKTKTVIIHLVANKVWGDGEQYVYDLIDNLKNEPWCQVSVVCKKSDIVTDRLSALSVDIRQMNLNGYMDIKSVVALSKMLNQVEGQCIIHAHDFKRAFIAVLAKKLSKNKYVSVVMTRHLVRKAKKSFFENIVYRNVDRIFFVSDLAKQEFLSSCILVLSAPIACLFNWGNFGLLFAVAILWMADALNRKQDILAGILWAFLMAKPQIGLLFAIPIALRFRWKTGLTAVAACLAASIPPAVLCHASPVGMTIDILTCPQRGQFCMDLLPMSWAAVFASGTPQHLFMFGGAVLCVVCCLRLRRSDDWAVFLLPPVLVSTVWTYGWPHDHCIYALLVFAIGVAVCKEREKTTRNWLIVAMVLCGSSILLMNGFAEPSIVALGRRVLSAAAAKLGDRFPLSLLEKQPKGMVYSAFAIAKVLAFCAFCRYLSRKPAFRVLPATA